MPVTYRLEILDKSHRIHLRQVALALLGCELQLLQSLAGLIKTQSQRQVRSAKQQDNKHQLDLT